jgi:hypothetical protein
MDTKLLKQVRFLRYYTFTITILFAGLLFMAFNRDSAHEKFKEIDVERINVIEKGGKLKLVISNAERQHPGIIDGKTLPKRDRPAGMIFFNETGDECGGLVYDGTKKSAGMVLSIDQYRNDQIMQLQYSEEADGTQKSRSYGLKLWDRPDSYPAGRLMADVDSVKRSNNEARMQEFINSLNEQGLLGKERLFVGKTQKDDVGLFIRDPKGRPRIKIFVDKDGKGNIQFLDTLGKQVPFQ